MQPESRVRTPNYHYFSSLYEFSTSIFHSTCSHQRWNEPLQPRTEMFRKKETKVEFVNIMLHIYLTRQGGVALTLFKPIFQLLPIIFQKKSFIHWWGSFYKKTDQVGIYTGLFFLIWKHFNCVNAISTLPNAENFQALNDSKSWPNSMYKLFLSQWRRKFLSIGENKAM